MPADKFGPPSATRNDPLGKRGSQIPDGEPLNPRAQSSHRTSAHSTAPPGYATLIARNPYTLPAVLIAFVIVIVGLFLLTDSRINDLESRLSAEIALAAMSPAPADNGNQLTAIIEINSQLDALQTALDELRAQFVAGKEPGAASINADTGVSETGPIPKAETKAAGVEVEVAKTETAEVAASEQIGAFAPAVQDSWLINIASFSQQKLAQQMQNKLESLGQSATTEPFNLEGKTLYRVRITGLPDRKTAEAQALRLQKELQLSGFWVARDSGRSEK